MSREIRREELEIGEGIKVSSSQVYISLGGINRQLPSLVSEDKETPKVLSLRKQPRRLGTQSKLAEFQLGIQVGRFSRLRGRQNRACLDQADPCLNILRVGQSVDCTFQRLTEPLPPTVNIGPRPITRHPCVFQELHDVSHNAGRSRITAVLNCSGETSSA